MPQGKVKWFSTEKAFGFIEQDNDNDIFVHVTGLADGVTMLDKDMVVEYEVEQGRKGPQAANVKPVTAPAAAAAPVVEIDEVEITEVEETDDGMIVIDDVKVDDLVVDGVVVDEVVTEEVVVIDEATGAMVDEVKVTDEADGVVLDEVVVIDEADEEADQ